MNTQMLTYRVNTQMLGVVRSCVGVRMCHGTDRPEQKQVEINRVDTEVLSTRILYTCFVRCVGVCVCVLCVCLGSDRRSQVETNRVDTDLLETRSLYTWGVCGKCVSASGKCVCVCQCSSGQQFGFHSKSGR